MSQEINNPYDSLSENSQSVGREIENKLIDLSIEEAFDVLRCVRGAIMKNSKVMITE